MTPTPDHAPAPEPGRPSSEPGHPSSKPGRAHLETGSPSPEPAVAPPSPGGRLTSPDVLMGLVLGAAGFYLGAMGSVIVLLAEDLGLQPADLGWVGSIFGVALLAIAFIGPALLRIGSQRLLAISTAMSAVGFIVLALGQTLPLVALGAGLQAAGGAATILLGPVLLGGPTADIRLTRVNAVSSVVSVVSPLVVGAMIAASLDGRLALLISAVPMAVVAAAAARNSRLPTPPLTIPDAPIPPPTAEGAVGEGEATADEAAPAVGEAAAGAMVPPGGDDVVGRPSPWLVLRRWLAIVMGVAAEFAFLVWAVARLVEAGLGTGLAATVGASFPIGMAVGRVLGPWVIAHLPAVPVGASISAVGTVLVVVGPQWPFISAGLILAGLGIATFYPVTLARLMSVPGLRQSLATSLGALASGTAITLAPAGLALLGSAMDLRLAYLVVLPLLGALVLLHGRARPTRRPPPPGSRAR